MEKKEEVEPLEETSPPAAKDKGIYVSWSAIRRGALVTGIVAAIVAALATSIVSSIGQTLKAASDYVLGNAEIARLSESNKQLSEEIDRIKQDQAEEREALVQIAVLHVPLPSRDASFCFDAVQDWIDEKKYDVTFADLDNDSLSFKVGDAVVTAACVGAQYANATFIVLSSPVTFKEQLGSVRRELAGDFWSINRSENVIFPKDEDWVHNSTFTVLAVVRLTITYGELQAWRKGSVPSEILNYLTDAGAKVDCDENWDEQVCRADFPLASIAFVGPGCDCDGEYPALEPFGSYYRDEQLSELLSQAAAEGARSALEKLKFGPPAPDSVYQVEASEKTAYDLSSPVRVSTFVIVSARNFGEDGLSSSSPLYTVNEMTNFLMKMPGVKTDLDVEVVMRDW